MNNRNMQIKFRLTEERSLIEEKMKQVPARNIDAYLRKMAIDGYIIQVDYSDIKKMVAELQKNEATSIRLQNTIQFIYLFMRTFRF